MYFVKDTISVFQTNLKIIL